MRQRIGLLLLGLLLVAVTGQAVPYANVGALFELGSGARPLGMGGAFVALADDGNAPFYNPAGLAWENGVTVSSLFARQFDALNYAAFSLAFPYFGVSGLALASGTIGTGETAFQYTSEAGLLSFGVPIGPVGLGARVKLYRVSAPYTATGWGIDPGVLVVLGPVRLGALYENAYSRGVTFADGHTESWTPSLNLGAAIVLSPHDGIAWSVSVEGKGLFGTTPAFLAGLEARVGALSARLGYDGAGLACGLSVRFASFAIDWAYATRSALPDSYRVSLTYRF
jgi:hypothetical protein